MKIRYRQLFFELLIWLAAEILLGFLGLDDLADYGEYLKEQDVIPILGSG